MAEREGGATSTGDEITEDNVAAEEMRSGRMGADGADEDDELDEPIGLDSEEAGEDDDEGLFTTEDEGLNTTVAEGNSREAQSEEEGKGTAVGEGGGGEGAESKESKDSAESKDPGVPAVRKKSSWSVLRSATNTNALVSDLLKKRYDQNKQAIEAFEERYKEMVMNMGGDLEDEGGGGTAVKRTKPLPHIIHFIEDCYAEKVSLLPTGDYGEGGGDFFFGDHVPVWHIQAAVDSMIAGARSAGAAASFRMSKRRFHEEEISAMEEFLVGADKIDHFGLDQVWGFDATKRYALDLVDAISGTDMVSEEDPPRPTLRSLAFRYVVPSNFQTEEWWKAVATTVKQHSQLTSVAFAFTRKKPVIAHNMAERSLDDCPEILERLLIAIGGNRNMQRVDLESVGLTPDDAKPIVRILKKCKKLTKLSLRKNSLGHNGTLLLAKHLIASKTLLEFDISGNNIGDRACIAIIGACNDHPTLSSVSFAGNDLTSIIIPHLSKLVETSSRLKALDLSYNFMGRGIIPLLHSIASNQTLQVLNIAYNSGTESCIGAIKHVLETAPPSLIEIDISGNQLPPDTGTVIRHAIKDNKTIMHINLAHNFVIRHDVIMIEQDLATKRADAAFKFRWEPKRLIQKYNFVTAKAIKAKSLEKKKMVVSRTDADEAVDQNHKKGRMTAKKFCADQKCVVQ
jgi:Ran GTPase-activating protein (RanGAP) involved in mRNA processing and transport